MARRLRRLSTASMPMISISPSYHLRRTHPCCLTHRNICCAAARPTPPFRHLLPFAQPRRDLLTLHASVSMHPGSPHFRHTTSSTFSPAYSNSAANQSEECPTRAQRAAATPDRCNGRYRRQPYSSPSISSATGQWSDAPYISLLISHIFTRSSILSLTTNISSRQPMPFILQLNRYEKYV